MRSVTELIRVAIGQPEFDRISLCPRFADQAHHFQVQEVELPMPAFRGFPDQWIFAVLDESRITKTTTPDAVRAEGRLILDRLPDQMPLVYLSTDERFHLGDEFTLPKRHVFCLDAHDLPQTMTHETTPRYAPFVRAFRRVLSSRNPALLWFSPYQRGRPVSGWRFFGRKRELEQLLYTNDNYVIVGGRRTGKTSLMLEAHRALTELGEASYHVDVQPCRTPAEAVRAIMTVLSARDAASAMRRHEALGDKLLSQVLKTITARNRRTTLFLDELGNVIADLPREEWSFLGTLRQHAQSGKLRVVISCFQEVFLRQQSEFSGPLINFAKTMRLPLFSDRDVEEFVLTPLEFWEDLEEHARRQLVSGAQSAVGYHPYFLQYYCHELLAGSLDGNETTMTVMRRSHELLRDDEAITACFADCVREIYFNVPSAAIQFLFVSRCHEADRANQELRRAEIDDEWVDEALRRIGYDTTVAGRRNLLEGMGVHGLTAALHGNPERQVVAAPMVYLYLKRTQPIERYLEKLARDISREEGQWGLVACAVDKRKGSADASMG